MRIACVLCTWLVAAMAALAQPRVLDSFDDAALWSVQPSDGVKATTSLVDGIEGKALRLEYNYEAGAGFVVLRFTAPANLILGDNFRFTFNVRGQGPKNNLEFKLVDPSGDNVWWLNQRAFEWPREWKQERIPARRIGFAWGPLGGSGPNPKLGKLGFIEFAIAASEGGQGFVEFDTLTFEQLPVPSPVTEVPTFKQSNASTIDIDLKQSREFGGLILDWDSKQHPIDYDVLASDGNERFAPVASVRAARGGKRFVPIEDGQGSALRLSIIKAAGTPALRSVEVPGVDFGSSRNDMFGEINRHVPAGWLPRYCRGVQSYWTVIGIPVDRDEALMNSDGAIEIATSGFSIEPFLRTDHLITWADVTTSQSLAEDYLPIPTVTWRAGDLKLDISSFADGEVGASTVVARYIVTNSGGSRAKGSLLLAVRPFQVLPPWQFLNITGGVTSIDSLDRSGDWIRVNGLPRIRTFDAAAGFHTSTFAAGDIVERYATGDIAPEESTVDPMRLASGALEFTFDLEPGKAAAFAIEALLRPGDRPASISPKSVDERLASAITSWKRLLNRATLTLPRSAKRISDTFRSTQAYILINQDGPAIQPGSRNYERSWMRDGSMTGAALLQTGHAEDTRRFIEWYASFQYPSGKVPCVVDRRGPDPVPEHDSHGELIYAIVTYYTFTHDREFLTRMWPHIEAAVAYIDSLRRQRMTDEYKQGEKRAMYGLVPESISHEGYSAKPMHSYWDSFFIVKGLHDAKVAAAALGKSADAERIGAMLDEYRSCLYDSMRLAMKKAHIDYIPGCVELGDFDATSTSIGVYPCGELGRIPGPQLARTFDRYFEFFENRRDGKLEWRDYTPYELRLLNTFIRIGRADRAHALLDYFFRDQRPQGWNHWAEVVFRDPLTPRFIGDMPHTWVGSEFLTGVRSMFVYERGESLVIGAGIRPEWPWEDEGVRITSFPTEFGILSYSMKARGDVLRVTVANGIAPAPGRCQLVLPADRAIDSVTINGAKTEIIRLLNSNQPAVQWNGAPATIDVHFTK